ncbi:DNA ligase [Ideonella margarita]|uniref:DNA ligase n=1 Tax=Ideonella margarita TaxID=2984191 RepID=A0ABU9CA32_9BURK
MPRIRLLLPMFSAVLPTLGLAALPTPASGADGAPPPTQAPQAASLPPALQLPREASLSVDPSGHLVSEKLDGVRAWWNGTELRSRGGLRINAPAWWLAALPREPLDGELWLGRGRFDETSALVRRGEPTDAAWHDLRFMVFDAPTHAGPFAQRVAHLQALLPDAGNGPAHAVAHRTFTTNRALRTWLDEVVAAGGEGLVLHAAAAPWQPGRQAHLLKLKPVQDADVIVIGHRPGKGRWQGQLGALTVRNADGQVFHVGSGLSDAQRRQAPPVGTTVSIRWRGLTATGLPRFATLWRVREAGW